MEALRTCTPLHRWGNPWPGHDLTGLPVDDLMQFEGIPDQRPSEPVTCCPGDHVVVAGPRSVPSLPFVVGLLHSVHGENDDQKGLVEWLHPGKSTEASFKVGRKKQIVDLFGRWISAIDIPATEILPLPSSFISPSEVLAFGDILDDDNQVHFKVLDKIQEHVPDFTGLSMSCTVRGNLYRTHRLMRSKVESGA